MTDALTTSLHANDSALVARARQDSLRQTYHFTAPAGWLNDPNGVGERDGLYHLFYQYNPKGPVHERIHWGHAVSIDLVHWHDRPIALTPGEGADNDGCWSGVLVPGSNPPTIVYSGRIEGQELACLAEGNDTLDEWTPRAQPIIAKRPQGEPLTAYRDHCVWSENGTWRQLIGSGIQGRGGCAFLYESDDLISWSELGPLVVGDAGGAGDLNNVEWTGTMWECVDFFRMVPGPEGETGPPNADSADPHVLIFSAWHEGTTLHSLAALGTYDGRSFTIDSTQRLDFGGRFAYAPQSFVDSAGRRVLWAWMQESRPQSAQIRAGWSGAMTVPRRMWLDSDLRLCAEPVAELRQLRDRAVALRDGCGPMREAESGELIDGRVIDMEVEVDLPEAGHLEILLFASPDGTERTVLRIERETTGMVHLSADRSHSTQDQTCDVTPRSGSFPHTDPTLRLRVLTDRSSLELFTAGVSLTTRVYPTRKDASTIEVNPSQSACVKSVQIWPMRGAEENDRQMYPLR